MNPSAICLKAAGAHPPVGTWIMSASPLVAEATGHAGFDWGGARHGAFAGRHDGGADAAGAVGDQDGASRARGLERPVLVRRSTPAPPP